MYYSYKNALSNFRKIEVIGDYLEEIAEVRNDWNMKVRYSKNILNNWNIDTLFERVENNWAFETLQGIGIDGISISIILEAIKKIEVINQSNLLNEVNNIKLKALKKVEQIETIEAFLGTEPNLLREVMELKAQTGIKFGKAIKKCIKGCLYEEWLKPEHIQLLSEIMAKIKPMHFYTSKFDGILDLEAWEELIDYTHSGSCWRPTSNYSYKLSGVMQSMSHKAKEGSALLIWLPDDYSKNYSDRAPSFEEDGVTYVLSGRLWEYKNNYFNYYLQGDLSRTQLIVSLLGSDYVKDYAGSPSGTYINSSGIVFHAKDVKTVDYIWSGYIEFIEGEGYVQYKGMEVTFEEVGIAIKKCSVCGYAITESGELDPDGDLVCEECFNNSVYYCSNCGEAIWHEDSVYCSSNGEIYCEECAGRMNLNQCDNCGECHFDCIEDVNGRMVCEDCLYHYVECAECGGLVYERYARYNSEGDEAYCQECFDNLPIEEVEE